MIEMHPDSRCKYEPEIKCSKTITCPECLEEENRWAKRWLRHHKKKPDIQYSEPETVQTRAQK